ncbi:MAG: hypothetical protein Q8941_07195 [Bacteroidota bacterium]|nr:hypothetical protein [Bacteroidota bacterium]
MNDNTGRFATFSDSRLIEIVRNAKQFGYDDQTRSDALRVLKERGITEEDLQLTGNLTNYKYDYARTLYNSYVGNSRFAFFSYSALLIFKAVTVFHLIDINTSGVFYTLCNMALFVLFLVALILSFLNHVNFYKAIGKEPGLGDQVIFFIIGMPFYIFMYFFYKKQMREEMKMVQS